MDGLLFVVFIEGRFFWKHFASSHLVACELVGCLAAKK